MENTCTDNTNTNSINSEGTATISAQLPIRLTSTVVAGFGRGSKDLGIPTANLCREHLKCKKMSFDSLPTGIYWGFARIVPVSVSAAGRLGEVEGEGEGGGNGEVRVGEDTKEEASLNLTHEHSNEIYKAAISVGYNPTYGNTHKTIEPHLIASPTDPQRNKSKCNETQFCDFYGCALRLSIVGYLRPELPFEGLEKLIEAIKNDIVQTERLADVAGVGGMDGDEEKEGDERKIDFLIAEEKKWVGSDEEE